MSDLEKYCYASRGLAGALGVGRNSFIKLLRKQGYILSDGTINQKYWGMGILRIVRSEFRGYNAVRFSEAALHYFRPIVNEAISKGLIKKLKVKPYIPEPLPDDLIEILNKE